jgi:hypothetical protein
MNVQRLVPLCAVVLFCAMLALVAGAADQQSQAEEGFTPIFNGKDLTGWHYSGDRDKSKKSKGYYARDGVLVCDKNATGNLYTDKEYDNFILRFDFKLKPNSNNGIGIHCPPTGGDIAYTGIEIQVLDDGGSMYKDIKPWQHHGSVYGCVAAKPEALKPVGEWNSEEILVDYRDIKHRHIKVTLNDTVIVDTDLDRDVTDPEVLKKHPGLQRTTGAIGLLGHTDETDFRNLRVKELK